MSHFALRLFGGFEARLDGKLLTRFESDKTRLLLAYLAIEADRPHRREELAGLFWPEKSEERARQSLSQALYDLRILLHSNEASGMLAATSKEIQFWAAENVSFDVRDFLALVEACRVHLHSLPWACGQCMEKMEQAASLVKGEFLSGFSLEDCEAFEAWLVEQREYLKKQASQVTHWLVEGFEKIGQYEKGLFYARKLVQDDPYDEQALQKTMRLLARLGKRDEALAQYESTRRRLQEELQVEPEQETATLYQEIRTEQGLKWLRPPNNLPASLKPLVGRHQELAQLYWKLVDPACRLITILGMGGSGKTHLALEASRAMLPAFADGVYWIELGPLPAQAAVLSTISKVLGLRGSETIELRKSREKRSLQEELFDYLRNKEVLLVLDSAEGVFDELNFLPALLGQAAKVKILVTSRLRVSLSSETIFSVSGLSYPEGQPDEPLSFSSVQLLVNTVQRLQPDYPLDREKMLTLAAICRLVQGMPLAILLAAGWVGKMEPGEILGEISRGFDLLSANWVDLPERQRSLRATFEYSWGLLNEKQRESMRRLGLFRQGFTLERAQRVSGISPAILGELIDLSMVQRVSASRYQMHDLVRDYALEKLIESPEECLETYVRFSDVYLAALADWDQRMHSAGQAGAMTEMDGEIENVRLAWDWRVQNGRLGGMEKALMGLCWYYEMRSQDQGGLKICREVLKAIGQQGLTEENLRLWARSSVRLDTIISHLGRDENTPELSEEVLQVVTLPEWSGADTRWEEAFAHQYLGRTHARQFPWREDSNLFYLQHLQAAQALFSQCEDRWHQAITLLSMATLHEADAGKYRQYAEEALRFIEPLGDPLLSEAGYYELACAYLFEGKVEQGLQAMRLTIASWRETANLTREAMALIDFSIALTWAGRYAEALEMSLQSLKVYRDLGREMPIIGKASLCGQKLFLGLYEDYFRQVEEFDLAHTAPFFYLLVAGAGQLAVGNLSMAEQLLDEALAFNLKIDDFRFLVYFRALLSLVRYRQGNRPQAWQGLEEAVQSWNAETNIFATCHLTLVMAYYLAEVGELVKAAEIYAAALQHPMLGNLIWAQDVAGKEITCKIDCLPREALEAARSRGEAMAYEQAIREGMESLRPLIFKEDTEKAEKEEEAG